MKSNNILEFNKIIEQLCNLALSTEAKDKLAQLKPSLNELECKRNMKETNEARILLDTYGTPPLSAMPELDKVISLSQKGSMLIPEQFQAVSQFLASSKRVKDYFLAAEQTGMDIAYFGRMIEDVSDLQEEISQTIRGHEVDDSVSSELRNIRKKIEHLNQRIKDRLESQLRGNKQWFADSYVSVRNGRFVLPVKKEYKNQVRGNVVGVSSTGSTCFIEPEAVYRLQEELFGLQIEEENEVYRILYTLTASVEARIPELKQNMETMEILDILFAKAKLSVDMEAVGVPITTKRSIRIVKGRHPLLPKEECVPLDFSIGDGINGVVITGPNTGGKTVSLKTVGLLSMMAQSGLHVPVEEGTVFSMNNQILCDIGDGQSITENLSTFSAHITNINEILSMTTKDSLVLLDELGSGTDPAEGMGIAIAILDELNRKGCLFVATTHYPEVKEYANKTAGLVNARMAFDRENLKPLYQLEIGEVGESCALYIARRLGFPEHLLAIARQEAYGIEAGDVKIKREETPNLNAPVIQKKASIKEPKKRQSEFVLGDSVTVLPEGETGIVYLPENDKGEIVVQVKGEKRKISYKRLKLKVAASELYPPDYDFSVIFDTVENRKARHKMGKRHQEDLTIEYNSYE